MNTAQILDELPRLTLAELDAVERRVIQIKSQPKPDRSKPDMEKWARELAELRRRTSTGKTGVPLQQLMDEIRGDR